MFFPKKSSKSFFWEDKLRTLSHLKLKRLEKFYWDFAGFSIWKIKNLRNHPTSDAPDLIFDHLESWEDYIYIFVEPFQNGHKIILWRTIRITSLNYINNFYQRTGPSWHQKLTSGCLKNPGWRQCFENPSFFASFLPKECEESIRQSFSSNNIWLVCCFFSRMRRSFRVFFSRQKWNYSLYFLFKPTLFMNSHEWPYSSQNSILKNEINTLWEKYFEPQNLIQKSSLVL